MGFRGRERELQRLKPLSTRELYVVAKATTHKASRVFRTDFKNTSYIHIRIAGRILLGWEMAEDFGVGGAVAALGDYFWGSGIGNAAAD